MLGVFDSMGDHWIGVQSHEPLLLYPAWKTNTKKKATWKPWPSRNSGFTHWKWWFSIAMLNYQRVIAVHYFFKWRFRWTNPTNQDIRRASHARSLRPCVKNWWKGADVRPGALGRNGFRWFPNEGIQYPLVIKHGLKLTAGYNGWFFFAFNKDIYWNIVWYTRNNDDSADGMLAF